MTLSRAILVGLLAVTRVAHAGGDEPNADDVRGAPAPGEESGRLDHDDGPGFTRQVGRAVLLIPRLAIEGALQPARGAMWLWDRYDPPRLYRRLFYFADGRISLTPTLAFDSGLDATGFTIGAAFTDRDAFGAHELVTAQAATGRSYRELLSLGLRSGERFGRDVHLELDAGYERRPHDAFYGIGNGDAADATGPTGPIDPRVDTTSLEARFRQARARISVIADRRLVSALHVRASAAWSRERFGPADRGTPIDAAYMPDAIPAYLTGIDDVYGEAEVRWDDRRALGPREVGSIRDAGSLASVFAGRAHRLDGEGPDYWRYGFDLEHFVRVAAGPRVLALRAHGEGVTGDRDDMPFTELPRLGGSTYLRGYPTDRFRDRVAALATAEYQWDLSALLSAHLFVDAGRVFAALDQLSLDRTRIGYGVSLEAHDNAGFIAEASLASSRDGGVFFNLAFNPVFDIDERVRRNR